MSVLIGGLPESPILASVNPLVGVPVKLTSGVTLTAPTSATLITGLTQSITVPLNAQYIRVVVSGKSATVTAAATITLGLYTGATTGTLTTLVGTHVVVAPTGGTSVAIEATFFIPVTSTIANTSFFVSAAATASTGDFVLNAASTEPTYMVVDCL
jgi:hypothetical protein